MLPAYISIWLPCYSHFNILYISFFIAINNVFVLMHNRECQQEQMILIESEDERPDIYTSRFDTLFGLCLFDSYHEFEYTKKGTFQKIQEEVYAVYSPQKQIQLLQNSQSNSFDSEHEQTDRHAGQVGQKQPQFQKNEVKLRTSRQRRAKASQKSKKTTRFASKIEENPVCELYDDKQSPLLLTEISQTASQGNSSKSHDCDKMGKKISKRSEKYIFREKHFKKSLKISFPKKIVEMFVNHYDEFQIDNRQVSTYNDNLKVKLKQNKKNDYTFEKEVSQILGESRDGLELSEELSKNISLTNRRIFSNIIQETMREEVIMRDKIAKNRELYMVQLKVYALRCRSHRLAKKGTFK